MKQPNVIIVMTDDQGYADLGCTGNPWLKTPHIDRFYESAVRFTDFHVQPLCTPTRGAIMTGRRPIRNGAWATCWGRSILRSSETTMADVFSANGYRTGLFGKWHLGDNYPYRPFDRGFEHTVAHKGGGVGQSPDFWGNNYFDDTYFNNGEAQSYTGYCTDIWFDQAMSWMDEKDDRPFFSMITTNAPHDPYLVDDKYAEPYRNNPEIVESEFYGMISNIDENFGKLEAWLRDRDLADNTILIFMTDNGSSGGAEWDADGFVTKGYNAGMRGKKASYYDGGHRVPFFIRWPEGALSEGRDIDEMALDVDMLPTLIELCGLNAPTIDFDGQSFAPTFLGHAMEDRTHFLQIRQGTDLPDPWLCCVMTKDWRLVGQNELFHIKDDPGQRHNVIQRFPEVAAKLRLENETWWKEAQGYAGNLCAIHLGAQEENPTTLVAIDLYGDDEAVWKQLHVVEAVKAMGKWRVYLEESGHYKFSLRRWPSELSLALENTISVESAQALAYGHPDVQHAKIKPDSAMLKLFGETHHVVVDSLDQAAVFELELSSAGETDLEAWFFNQEKEISAAYFVEVERLSNC